MQDPAEQFLSPANSTHRKYEALRAHFVDRVPLAEAARRFGYAVGTLRNLRAEFCKRPEQPFFLPDRRGKRKPAPGPDRDQRIVALRKEQGLSAAEIAERLRTSENLPVSATTVARVLRRAGLPKLWRRTDKWRAGAAYPECAAVADHCKLNLDPRKLRTDFGGLFLFAGDLARLGLDGILAQCGMPGSSKIPAGCAFRSLLALKLWGIGRPSHVMSETLDEGLALFAGLNAMPKRATLTEYSCRVDPRDRPALMDRWHLAVRGLGVELGGGQSFDLDFHTIPYHGDDALIEKHSVSKRSRRQKGVLAFLARDADARLFAYANAQLRKADHNDEILCFVDHWRARTGTLPAELVFDSRLTTYANLARLAAMGIAFLTLRRRTPKMVAALRAAPPEAWRKITLTNVGRIYRTPRVLEQTVRLKDYSADLRQIAIIDLGHEKPTLLLTNQMTTPRRPTHRPLRPSHDRREHHRRRHRLLSHGRALGRGTHEGRSRPATHPDGRQPLSHPRQAPGKRLRDPEGAVHLPKNRARQRPHRDHRNRDRRQPWTPDQQLAPARCRIRRRPRTHPVARKPNPPAPVLLKPGAQCTLFPVVGNSGSVENRRSLRLSAFENHPVTCWLALTHPEGATILWTDSNRRRGKA